jgi:N-acetylglucosamine-6-phosphate deacetylase
LTLPFENVRKAVANLPEHPMIPGFHMEGPFISPQFPGAQPPEAIVPIPSSDSEWDEILNHPKLKVITLAPELSGAHALTTRLSKRGVRVSMGHTAASFEQAARAVESGLCQATHAFNAMQPFHHREAGATGAALLCNMDCELIYDRLHVCMPSASLLLSMKSGRVIAISDSTMASGLPAGMRINMWGHNCLVGHQEVRLSDSGALAGSAVTLRQVFANMVQDFGLTLATDACCDLPRRILGLGDPAVWNIVDSASGELIEVIRKP